MNEIPPTQPADEPVPAIDAEKLLGGQSPTEAPAGAVGVAGLLGALRAPARPYELSGEKGALDAFRAAKAAGVATALKEKDMLEPGSPFRRLANPRFGAKAAVAAVACSLALGGVAAAATTGSLPGPLQTFAHVLGAPAAGDNADSAKAGPTGTDSGDPTTEPTITSSTDSTANPSASGSPTRDGGGPNALGPAAWGLCHAFGTKTWGNGFGQPASAEPAGRKPDNPSVAYRNLVAAAAAKGLTVDAFCGLVLANHAAPSTWPTAKPSGQDGSPPAVRTQGHGQGNGTGNEHGNANSAHNGPSHGGGNGHGQG
jgi:hypothetical protein